MRLVSLKHLRHALLKHLGAVGNQLLKGVVLVLWLLPTRILVRYYQQGLKCLVDGIVLLALCVEGLRKCAQLILREIEGLRHQAQTLVDLQIRKAVSARTGLTLTRVLAKMPIPCSMLVISLILRLSSPLSAWTCYFKSLFAFASALF